MFQLLTYLFPLLLAQDWLPYEIIVLTYNNTFWMSGFILYLIDNYHTIPTAIIFICYYNLLLYIVQPSPYIMYPHIYPHISFHPTLISTGLPCSWLIIFLNCSFGRSFLTAPLRVLIHSRPSFVNVTVYIIYLISLVQSRNRIQ